MGYFDAIVRKCLALQLPCIRCTALVCAHGIFNPQRLANRNGLWHDNHMPKRVKQQKRANQRSGNVKEIARRLVDLSIREPDNGEPHSTPVPKSVSRYMAEIGRKGGQIGGKQRLHTMSAEQRQVVAQKAARARWERRNELERKN